MVKKKRQFHCQRCGMPCDIYKKGKNHRVLVCPKHGVIATNPNVLKTIADIGTDFIPGGKLVKMGLSAVGLNPLDDNEEAKGEKKERLQIQRLPEDRYTTEERVHDALA